MNPNEFVLSQPHTARRGWAVISLLLAAGCGAQAAPAADVAVADAAPDDEVALADAIVCSHPLAALTLVPLTSTIADAMAAAQKFCGIYPLSAGQVACADGGVAIYDNDNGGDRWWFDASGQLIGYEWTTDNGFATGCLENMWGSNGLCTANPEASPARVSICATPTDASDASDAMPDSADAAIDVPLENTACSSQSDCGAGTWCNYTGCGFTLGQCVVKPTDCTGQFSPICGCDGHSYDSVCAAEMAGKSIAASSAPCLGSGCAPACASGHTCVDCASGGVQCLTPGQKCVAGK